MNLLFPHTTVFHLFDCRDFHWGRTIYWLRFRKSNYRTAFHITLTFVSFLMNVSSFERGNPVAGVRGFEACFWQWLMAFQFGRIQSQYSNGVWWHWWGSVYHLALLYINFKFPITQAKTTCLDTTQHMSCNHSTKRECSTATACKYKNWCFQLQT